MRITRALPRAVRFSLSVLGIMLWVLSGSAAISAPLEDNWWDVVPEDEKSSAQYESILYSQIAPRLRQIQLNSNRVDVEVIGKSADGRNLFLVTVAAPGSSGRFGHYQSLRRLMISDPELALIRLDQYKDFKVPVFLNGSIHGDEYPGTDAVIRLIETLAYSDSPEVQAFLEHMIVLVNVVQNPDGRVLGTRRNAAGFDLNRDFITQTQPETRATVSVVTEWNPMVFLDLHGFVSPMLIEPCTPPHNPNYEYDLYLKWAFYQAEAMEAELFAQTGLSAQIPFRDDSGAWDDWAPIYGAMYPMFHGAYGHTLETPYRDERGVDAHYAAMWGMLKFVAANKEGMIRDQIEVFRRGFLALQQLPIPPELLDETKYDQFKDLIIKEFPAAYVIPQGAPFQSGPHWPARLVDFMLFNDLQVHQADRDFMLDGVAYPKGSYVVWMDQPKRGLANTILEDGLDVSGIEGLEFYSPPSAWSHPLLWGVNRAVMAVKENLETHEISQAAAPLGSVDGPAAAAYAYEPTSIAAFKATNDLLRRGLTVHRASAPFENFGVGTIIVPPDPALALELAEGYALDVFSLERVPEAAKLMKKRRIALFGDEGVAHCLKQLGFDYGIISLPDLQDSLSQEYDVLLNQNRAWSGLGGVGRRALAAFFNAGGDYIGLSGTGAQFARDAGLLDVDGDGASDFDTYQFGGNAILRIDYDSADTVAAGFREQGYGFVNGPLFFIDVAEGIATSARVAAGSDFLVSGFWPDWQASGAANLPVVIHGGGSLRHVTLVGIDPTFRGHPENTFRIVGNAIFSGLD